MAVTPEVAQTLAEECDASKPYLEDGTLNEAAAGDDNFCRWAVFAFPNGEWAKFKSFLLEYEQASREARNQVVYYRNILESRNKKQ